MIFRDDLRQISEAVIFRTLNTVVVMALILGISAGAAAMDLRDQPKTELRQATDKVDELLGGSRTDDIRSKSTLRLSGTERIARDQASESKFNIKFNLKLGVLQRWQKELQNWFNGQVKKVETEVEDEFRSSSRKSTIAPTSERDGRDSAKPTPSISSPPDSWHFSLEKHFSVKRRPDYWIHGRLRKDVETKHVFHSFSAEAGYSRSQKWESQMSLGSTIHLAPLWTLSFANNVEYLISEKSFGTSHGPSLSYLPGHNQVATLSAGVATAVKDHVWFSESYSISLGYRIRAWKDWVFFSANPYLAFAKSEHFRGSPGADLSAEMVF